MGTRGMKNGLAVLAGGSLLLLAIGWYQDWYRVERATSMPGFYNLHIGIHTDKVNNDFTHARAQVEQGGKWIQARCQEMGEKKQDTVNAPKSEPHHHDPVEESSINQPHTPPVADPVPNKWK